MWRWTAGFFTLLLASVCFADGNPPLLLHHPTLNATQIVFVYADDLWTVARSGGEAQRLTAGNGVASRPVFSPDGKEIAFTGDYDGNADVYVIPATGGTPKRLTYHPAVDEVLGWTRDGKSILFASNRNSYSRFSQLFTISREGGFPSELPLPMGAEGSYSPDGKEFAYVPLDHAFEIWKRYAGGRTSPIWIATLADSSIAKLPRENSNDFNPMWVGDRIYFLSDRNGPMSLFSYDRKSQNISPALKNDGLDFKYASAGPDAIVIEQFGAIWLYDLKTGAAHKVDIRISAELPQLRPRYENVANRIRNADVSPTGVRAVFEARGEILTVPAEKGDIRNLTNTPGADERYPAWSPDGTRIAYFSDESGEVALHIKNQSGQGETEKIDLGTPGSFFFFPTWSPDSKQIAYTDKRLNLWYVDLEKKTPVKVFHDRFTGPQQIFQASWSPDSKWLAYTQQGVSHMRSVFLYSLDTGKSERVTDGMSDSFSPVFDKSGKYLYLLSSTDAGPLMDASMLSYDRPVTSSVYIVVLSRDLPSPLAPESDEESAAKDETRKADAGKAAASEKDKEKPAAPVKIDFEKIGQRILALPIPARNYTELQTGKDGVLFAVEGPLVEPLNGPGALTVHRFELKTRRADKLLDNVLAFHVSANGEKLLYRHAAPPQPGVQQPAQTWTIAPLPPAPVPGASSNASGGSNSPAGAKTLNLSSMEVRIEPVTEWKEMYHEAFRIERDFFYDPNFHGLDLAAKERTFAAYLPAVASRDDLNYIFEETMGDLKVGHLFVRGGDGPEVKRIPVGLLGADYKIENGRYRFARVYDGENWNPQLRAPLTQPGVNVAEGEYLLAVNGHEVRGSDSVYSFFEATAGKSVLLRVGPNPDGSGSREVTVVPIENERGLRNLAWIEGNRRKVDELSNGRLAYIYLPDTASGGYTYFNRYFFSQAGKDGAVVDERFNGGGTNTDYILDYLRRTLMNYRTTRDGEDMTTPVSLIQGPKAMIINEYAGSGGDAMPWHFRQAKVGVLVGKRTWGGLVGFFGPGESLMDGGTVTAPSRGFWTPNNQWEVENRGIAPDVEVEFDPKAVREGHDSQLEKTVQILVEELEKNPIPTHKKPPYPNYHPKPRGSASRPSN
ncbi:MAG TPA: PDZ domain-containing protein [Candidatus Methylomirabilis sp.]|nr:PDZ domain-containing protein [Candidatus Methylomirabilis sp.]